MFHVESPLLGPPPTARPPLNGLNLLFPGLTQAEWDELTSEELQARFDAFSAEQSVQRAAKQEAQDRRDEVDVLVAAHVAADAQWLIDAVAAREAGQEHPPRPELVLPSYTTSTVTTTTAQQTTTAAAGTPTAADATTTTDSVTNTDAQTTQTAAARRRRAATTATDSPTAAPTNTDSPTAAPTNTDSPTAAPTNTDSPTVAPTNTDSPTAAPTNTDSPTAAPTNTDSPTAAPTNTDSPTAAPTNTDSPTAAPTNTDSPTAAPTTTTPEPTTTKTITTTTIYRPPARAVSGDSCRPTAPVGVKPVGGSLDEATACPCSVGSTMTKPFTVQAVNFTTKVKDPATQEFWDFKIHVEQKVRTYVHPFNYLI